MTWAYLLIISVGPVLYSLHMESSRSRFPANIVFMNKVFIDRADQKDC